MRKIKNLTLILVVVAGAIVTPLFANENIKIAADRDSMITISTGKEVRSFKVSPGQKYTLEITEGVTAPATPTSATSEKKECKSAYGKTVCGYGCVSAYGEIKCGELPGSACIHKYGKIICGFDCKAAYGDLKCATKLGGACQAAYGKITCSG